MISSYLVDKIEYSVQIIEYMDKNLNLKYKDLIKGVEQDLLFSQRNVERYIKTSTGLTPKTYYERRKLTNAILEIIENPDNINTIYKKYKFSKKKELKRMCKIYLNTDLDSIIENKEFYRLQQPVSKEDILSLHERWAELAYNIKLMEMGEVRRKENVYKIKFTLDKMPIYVLPELKYNAIRDDYKEGKFDRKGLLLRIAIIDKSIKENTNKIIFDKKETAIIVKWTLCQGH